MEHGLHIGLALVVGIPVLLVVGTIGVLVGAGVWLLEGFKQVLGLPKSTTPPSATKPPPQHVFTTAQLNLSSMAVDLEDEVGEAFSEWNYDVLGPYSPGVRRLITTPEIPGLHSQLVGALCREWPDGIFLQLFEPTFNQPSAGTSWLVYLELATLSLHKLEEVGGFYLSAKYTEHGLFEGKDANGAAVQFRVEGIEEAFLSSPVI
ncbi:hypothetical protein GCM10027346_00230 [Hymenobacter seoulensis]